MIKFTDETGNKVYVQADCIKAIIIASALNPQVKNTIMMTPAGIQSNVSTKEALRVLALLGEEDSNLIH